MPDATGCELLAEVRQRWPWIGRVILTAHSDPMSIRAVEAGVDFSSTSRGTTPLLKARSAG
jgi:DNA-binding NarL/FixJ family response regulator